MYKGISKKIILLTTIIYCFFCVSIFSQELKEEENFEISNETDTRNKINSQEETEVDNSENTRKIEANQTDNLNLSFRETNRRIKSEEKTQFVNSVRQIERISLNIIEVDEPLETPETRVTTNNQKPERFQKSEKFHWKSAINESLIFLGIQQGFRMVQKKTRNELDGEFFADWGTSVKNLGGWRDGDSFATNYIAHPMQGAVTGRIFINNSDRSKKLEFGDSEEYWKSRAKALVWSTVWSTQFELGPISEASIGNVGLYDRTGPNRMGWVDLVVTPVAGTAVIIGEDMIDKYILKKWLERGSSRAGIRIYRTFFTPFQSFTNVLRWRVPWKRDNR